MRIPHLLFSAVQFLFVVVIGCAGFFLMALPWAPHVRFKCAVFLFERDDLFIPLGALLLAVGLILAIGFYFIQKKPYFQVKMHPPVEVEVDVLQALLESYWKKLFPEEKLKTDIVLHRSQQIELVAELPSLDNIQMRKLLKDVEHDVGHLLARHLGYKREFLFTFLTK